MAQIETGMVCGCEINGTDWENDLLANAPDWFDDDVSQSEIVTRYTLSTEPGTSLRAAGWTQKHETDGGSWDRGGRNGEHK